MHEDEKSCRTEYHDVSFVVKIFTKFWVFREEFRDKGLTVEERSYNA